MHIVVRLVLIALFLTDQVKSKIILPTDGISFATDVLMANRRDGIDTVTIPAGIYRIPLNNHPNANILFTHLQNLTINAADVTFIMLDNRKRGLVFYDCFNVTVRGPLIVRNEVPPFSQGTVESIDRQSFVINIHDGYPMNLLNDTLFPAASAYYIFDRHTRRLKDRSRDYYNTRIDAVDHRRFKIGMSNDLSSDIATGDLVSMRGRGEHGILVEISELMHFLDVHVEFAGLLAWFELEGRGNNRYERISARPGPKPVGSAEEPLMSANADGFHSGNVRHGPTVLDSFFTRMPDDGIAIHGEYQMIRQVRGNTVVCMRKLPRVPYIIGDRVGVVGVDGMPRGQAYVQRIRELPVDALPPVKSEWPHFNENRYYFELDLDSNMNGNIFVNDYISNLDQTGSNFYVRGNYIFNNRARGIIIKAQDGIIESNRVDGSSMSGIVLQPELWWGEGNYAERVTIRKNNITRCGYATSGPWTEQAGILTVYGTGKSLTANGHHSLTIEDNIFSDNDGTQMVLDSLKYVSIRRNVFQNGQNRFTDRGYDHGIDGGTIIHVNRATSLTFEGNRAKCMGPIYKKNFHITSLANRIDGTGIGLLLDHSC